MSEPFRLPSDIENQAGDELVLWYRKYCRRAPHGVLAGMLMSAAAELLSSEPTATRELLLEIAGRAWDGWRAKRRGTDRGTDRGGEPS